MASFAFGSADHLEEDHGSLLRHTACRDPTTSHWRRYHAHEQVKHLARRPPGDRRPVVVVTRTSTKTEERRWRRITYSSSGNSSSGSLSPVPRPPPPPHSRPPPVPRPPALASASSESCLNDKWWLLGVTPSPLYRPRSCDEVPDEFRRAGIGLCFGGACLPVISVI